ncbi:hypothetical protein ACFOEX_11365, partial [Camelimonas abortus]
MLLILYVLAAALAAGGAWAIAAGAPMIVLERGWTMVISGSVAVTGAAIVFALAMVTRAIRQLPDQLEAGVIDEPQAASAGASRPAAPFLPASPPRPADAPAPAPLAVRPAGAAPVAAGAGARAAGPEDAGARNDMARNDVARNDVTRNDVASEAGAQAGSVGPAAPDR